MLDPNTLCITLSDTEEYEPIVINKWSEGPVKPTDYKTLRWYHRMEYKGGLGGGGESLSYPNPFRGID